MVTKGPACSRKYLALDEGLHLASCGPMTFKEARLLLN